VSGETKTSSEELSDRTGADHETAHVALGSRRTETAGGPRRFVEQLDDAKRDALHPRDHHLSDAIAAPDRKWFFAMIHENDADGTAIIRVDRAR
jgi:hypothetical protein